MCVCEGVWVLCDHKISGKSDFIAMQILFPLFWAKRFDHSSCFPHGQFPVYFHFFYRLPICFFYDNELFIEVIEPQMKYAMNLILKRKKNSWNARSQCRFFPDNVLNFNYTLFFFLFKWNCLSNKGWKCTELCYGKVIKFYEFITILICLCIQPSVSLL